MHEQPILKKLDLLEHYPSYTMDARKNALGVGIMRPKTIFYVQRFKLHVTNNLIHSMHAS